MGLEGEHSWSIMASCSLLVRCASSSTCAGGGGGRLQKSESFPEMLEVFLQLC